jgi:aminoglycoside 3-N-acetyltransferase I
MLGWAMQRFPDALELRHILDRPTTGRAMTTLRTLDAHDEPLMRGMLAMFSAAFEDPQHYADNPPSGDYLRGLLASPTFIAIVALDGPEVVGGIAAYELPKFEQARSEIYLYDLAVAQSHRRRGIATAMVEHLQAVAAERGARVIYVQADPGDDAAVALYTKLGLRADVLHFDIAPRPRRG